MASELGRAPASPATVKLARELGRAGTEAATVKLWDHIERNPGCTVDDLVKMAAEDASIPIGARRAYAKHLTWAHGGRAGRPALPPRDPRDVDPDKAIRHVVVSRLASMRRFGSVLRDIHGRYYTARPLNRRGYGALVQQPEVVREDIARRQTLIIFRKWRAKHPDGKAFFPKALFDALVTWDEISASDYFAQRAETEARLSSTVP